MLKKSYSGTKNRQKNYLIEPMILVYASNSNHRDGVCPGVRQVVAFASQIVENQQLSYPMPVLCKMERVIKAGLFYTGYPSLSIVLPISFEASKSLPLYTISIVYWIASVQLLCGLYCRD